jgi:hypothetical protein
MKRNRLAFVGTTITATYQGKTATATVTVNGSNPLVSISIDDVPTTALAVGETVTLAAPAACPMPIVPAAPMGC